MWVQQQQYEKMQGAIGAPRYVWPRIRPKHTVANVQSSKIRKQVKRLQRRLRTLMRKRAAKKAVTDTKIVHGRFGHESSEVDPCNVKQEAAFSKHGRFSRSAWLESEAKIEVQKIK